MRTFTATTDLELMLGAYGPTYANHGLLSEHTDAFTAAGGTIGESITGRAWAVLPDGRALPVVCSEIIRVETEDGPVSGRCGAPAEKDGACEYHADIIAAWRAQSEADAAWRERTGAAYA